MVCSRGGFGVKASGGYFWRHKNSSAGSEFPLKIRESPKNSRNSGLGSIVICPDIQVYMYVQKDFQLADLHPKGLTSIPKCIFQLRFFVAKCVFILLIEEILHHLGCIKLCKYWDKLSIY